LTHKRHSLRWIVARHNGHRPNSRIGIDTR
jgi:hypothetical protein